VVLSPKLHTGLCSRPRNNPDCNLEPRECAYSERMRIALVVVGVFVALFGLLFTLQGLGVVQGSPMSNTTTWSILGPIIALVGIALAVGAMRRKS
jgi:hypothetical protein